MSRTTNDRRVRAEQGDRDTYMDLRRTSPLRSPVARRMFLR